MMRVGRLEIYLKRERKTRFEHIKSDVPFLIRFTEHSLTHLFQKGPCWFCNAWSLPFPWSEASNLWLSKGDRGHRLMDWWWWWCRPRCFTEGFLLWLHYVLKWKINATNMDVRRPMSGGWNDGPREEAESSLEARRDREQWKPTLSPFKLGFGTFLERSSGINREWKHHRYKTEASGFKFRKT